MFDRVFPTFLKIIMESNTVDLSQLCPKAVCVPDCKVSGLRRNDPTRFRNHDCPKQVNSH